MVGFQLTTHRPWHCYLPWNNMSIISLDLETRDQRITNISSYLEEKAHCYTNILHKIYWTDLKQTCHICVTLNFQTVLSVLETENFFVHQWCNTIKSFYGVLWNRLDKVHEVLENQVAYFTRYLTTLLSDKTCNFIFWRCMIAIAIFNTQAK